MKSGEAEFIAKPIQDADLWERIERCLNIEFLYDDRQHPAADRSEAQPLTKGRISDLPPELIEEVLAAVQGGYMERLSRLVKGAAEHHPVLAQQLQKLIDQYDYEALV